MKAIMVMFDSLNRHMLPNYGCDWIKAPNFERLGKHAVTFDNFYVGSLPCMPARRELHTGRYNFLHRSWGPMEPFDFSMPEALKKNGVHTHLVSDHYHYVEDGGATYHTKYKTWEICRGQEGDSWNPKVDKPNIPDCENPRKYNLDKWEQDWKNREIILSPKDQPIAKTFKKGIDFLELNKESDNWFLQLETFDPHEPFFTFDEYKELYPHEYSGKHYDWFNYGRADHDVETVEHLKYQYASLVSMCDHYLGKVLDKMDELNLWEDTMLIVNTDHGLMLGEKEWYGKNIQPFYQEISHLPFFVYDPRNKDQDKRNSSLCQTIDIAPTLLDFFEQDIPTTVQGNPVGTEHDAMLFGVHGGHINVTDGNHVYMRSNHTKSNGPLFEYTLMPTHMRSMFSIDELRSAELVEADTFNFIDVPVLKTKATAWLQSSMYGDLLFDLKKDYAQEHPLQDEEKELEMLHKLRDLMIHNDAPSEQFERIGINKQGDILREIQEEDEGLSVDSPIAELLADSKGNQIMQKYFKEYIDNGMIDMMKSSSLRIIAQMSQGRLTEEMLEQIDKLLKDE